jgi:hypothetical protein
LRYIDLRYIDLRYIDLRYIDKLEFRVLMRPLESSCAPFSFAKRIHANASRQSIERVHSLSGNV